MQFRDRRDAGRRLAEELRRFADDDVMVLALPRGGVPVGFEVARALHAPLDVIGVRKLGAPMQPELAVGAIAEGGVRLLDEGTIGMLGIDAAALDEIEAREREELRRRTDEYRSGRGLPALEGRTVIVVDDGLATGSTARAACRAARAGRPGRVVLAVPVGAAQSVEALRAEADELVCVHVPPSFQAVGAWYRRFDQTTDAEVRRMLAEANGGDGPEGG